MGIVETPVCAHVYAVSQQVKACVDTAIEVQVAGGISYYAYFACGLVG